MSDESPAQQPEQPEAAEQQQQDLPGPGAFLKGVVGQHVVVRLNSGVDYRGVLSCLDGYMNIALEQTEEYVNGQKTNDYGDAFVRGNNGDPVHLSTVMMHSVPASSESTQLARADSPPLYTIFDTPRSPPL
ncbi:hypothetical protein BMF94_2747 [Rhodotorula taiwanensis]|uniref:U6 snRNA-associated Sm-like protein LSm6 n=1 Tax=Rhodotorula taiwanensis TaxID=741276 RepID=A0A2S5BBP3_9BASI|nr:hypothetical protein BMF94_2747 [Rhodotorula taiwanensis]